MAFDPRCFSFNQLSNTLKTLLKQKTDCRMKVFSKRFVLQSIFVTGRVAEGERGVKTKNNNHIMLF